jgi:DNA end-binding protein Ku
MKLGSSVKANKGLRQVRVKDGAKIEYLRHAQGETEEVPWDQIGKGYDAPDGSLVVMTDDEQKAVYGEKNRVAKVLMFTDASHVPPMAAKTCYWVQPDTGGEKVYALLASSLQATGKVAVIEFAMRQKMEIAVLRPLDGFLALESLEWDADLIRPDFNAPADVATEQEHELARNLIQDMSGKYDHSEQRDVSREAMMAAIQAKLDTGQVLRPASVQGSGPAPLDLTAQLQAAVEAQKPKEGETQPVPKPRAQRATTRRKANA